MYGHSKCPSYEEVTCPETNEALKEAIRGEAEAIKFYTHLVEMAPDQCQKDVISGIRDDERRHLHNFQAVYCWRTGRTCSYPEPDVYPPQTYCQGLAKAFNDEQEAYEFYKANYFCMTGNWLRKLFWMHSWTRLSMPGGLTTFLSETVVSRTRKQ